MTDLVERVTRLIQQSEVVRGWIDEVSDTGLKQGLLALQPAFVLLALRELARVYEARGRALLGTSGMGHWDGVCPSCKRAEPDHDASCVIFNAIAQPAWGDVPPLDL